MSAQPCSPLSLLIGISWIAVIALRWVGARGKWGISRKARDGVRNDCPRLRALKPNGHRRREGTGIIKARDRNGQQVRRGGEHRRSTSRTKLSADDPRTFRLYAITRSVPLPGDRRCWHEHV